MLLVMILSMAAPASARLPAAPPERESPAEYASSAITQSLSSAAPAPLAPSAVVTITLLHTNDFHGQLEASGSIPGITRTAYVINQVRSAVGAANTLLVDAGDEMQGSLLSNLKKGEPTIDLFNFVGYQAATFGNHEFDWGQQTLISRTTQASYPFIAANLVVSDSSSCATAGWTSPSFAKPWITMTVGAPGNQAIVGILGVTTQETPYITIASATQGLCFKDPADSIAHYYDAVKAAGANTIIVLSHLGYTDGGYGYGLTVYGDQTLAKKLVEAGKPVPLIIGGHSHTNLFASTNVSGTTIVQAYYNGRKVGRADLTIDTTANTTLVSWQPITVTTSGPSDAGTAARLATWTSDPVYQSQINQFIGMSNVDLRTNYNGDSLMGEFIDDALYNDLNNDANPANDVDMFFNNAGGIRTEGITSTVKPFTLTYGALFNILPFGNQTIVGDMTGAQIYDLLDQSATLFKGALQVSGIRFSFYSYTDTLPGSQTQPYAWGAYSVTVKNRSTSLWEPLVITKTYRVGTNEFLAPAGQDGYLPFKYMTNISYWGDMLDGVDRWVGKAYSTTTSAYNGPNNDGQPDGRVMQTTEVIPLTILHHNDSHGNLAKGAFVGYTQLATLINQERAHNPSRTILLDGGDQIQGDAMMAYYKAAFTGIAGDGATALPITLTTHPMMAAMNAMTYTAMTLGNHEFNFGNYIFTGTLKQANFPLLQANLYDDGRYGISQVPIKPFITTTVGSENIKVAVLGIGNHRVPQYELPSNIPGLTFTNPITEAQSRAPALKASNDVMIALTHIGFTTISGSLEVDLNVDTNLAAQTTGIDAIIGSHSHTDPSKQTLYSGDYKYLPAFVGSADGIPVIINQAYRYNNTLGEVVLGLLPKAGGGYQVVSRAGRYLPVTMSTPEDARIKAIIDPYANFLAAYNTTILGKTSVPIDTLNAFTQETNGANLQADASVAELARHGINVDFHLSGAMTNKKVADTATASNPYTLTIQDMFNLMPYENSLVVMRMNGPQLKTVLERAYRNYYYYKYVPGYGGYSYYTTCMIDINKGGQITYRDTYPALPNGNNVASLVVNGTPIDLSNANKYYTVSTVNYLAAGSCNNNDGGVTIWPLNQIVADTQYYVRDAVVNYIPGQTQPIAPAIEGRLVFAPVGDPAPNLSTSRKTVVDANGNGIAEAGEALTYTIIITNSGNYGAGVVVVDALPTGLTYVPGSLSVSYPSGSALIPNFVAQFYGNTLLGYTNGFLNPPSGGSLYLPTNVIAITFRAQVSNPAPAGTSLSNSIDLQDQIMHYTIPPAVIRLPYRLYLPIIMK
jgi:uncharacterized repeat protein (TIGR01451 family)